MKVQQSRLMGELSKWYIVYSISILSICSQKKKLNEHFRTSDF